MSGVPANSTAWTGPTAASVFQDIQSDNWDGSVPPTYSNSSTWGTQGYYLRQGNTVGSPSAIYINNGVFRGDVTTSGLGWFKGITQNISSVYIGGARYTVATSLLGSGTNNPSSSSYCRSGIYGLSNVQYTQYNIGIIGEGSTYPGTSTNGIGVVGGGDLWGGYFSDATGLSTTIGLVASHSAGNTAFWISNGTFQYGSTTINVPPTISPTNYYLRGDGQWTLTSTITAGVSSFNTRTGAVTLSSSDVTTALGYTPYNSTNPSGYVTASTSSLTNYSTTTVTQSYINSYAAHQFNADTGTAYVSSGNLNIYVTITGFQSAGSGNTITIQSVSDRALKQNIVPESLGLDFIKQLIPVSYSMIKGDGRKMHGFIAQDVAPLISGDNDALKITNPDGTKGLDYLSLIGPMAKAIQELSAQVDQLKVALNRKSG